MNSRLFDFPKHPARREAAPENGEIICIINANALKTAAPAA